MSSAPPRWSPQAKRSSEVTPPERRAPGKNVKLTMAVVEGDHSKKLARPPNGKKESSTKPKVGSHYVHGDHGGARGASFTVPKRRLSLPFAGAEAAPSTSRRSPTCSACATGTRTTTPSSAPAPSP